MNCPIIQDDLAAFLYHILCSSMYRSILELGTNIGYSSVWMALASQDIHIDTVEFKKENIHLARKYLKHFNLNKQVDIYHSEAIAFLKNKENIKNYDFVFIDANKKSTNKAY